MATNNDWANIDPASADPAEAAQHLVVAGCEYWQRGEAKNAADCWRRALGQLGDQIKDQLKDNGSGDNALTAQVGLMAADAARGDTGSLENRIRGLADLLPEEPEKAARAVGSVLAMVLCPPINETKDDGIEEDPVPETGDVWKLQHEVNGLRDLTRVTLRITRRLDLDTLLEDIVDRALQLSGAERGFVLLKTDDGFYFEVARDLERSVVAEPEYEISRSIADRAMTSGEMVVTDSAQEDPRFRDQVSIHRLSLRSIICLPLRSGDETLGALYLDNRTKEGVFQAVDREILSAYAAQVAVSIDNARLHDEVQSLNRRLREKVAHQEVEIDTIRDRLAYAGEEAELKYEYDNIIGRSPAMRNVLQIIDRVTPSEISVLITGDSGTGKELVARALHHNGPRKAQPFMALNCAGVPTSLLESELFGHKKGAFTGADKDRRGLFEVASGGTLFLDEIGDMPMEMQGKLLRVLQESEVRPVGSANVRKVDVRVIAATHRDLKAMVKEGTFREDLFFRLKVIEIGLPSLRDRKEDVPALVEHFLSTEAQETGAGRKSFSEEAMRMLLAYMWPGNIRQLQNAVRRAYLMASDGDVIRPEDLPPEVMGIGSHALGAPPETNNELKEARRVARDQAVDDVERAFCIGALTAVGGNVSEAARRSGMNRTALHRMMTKLGIDPREFKMGRRLKAY